MLSRDRPAVGLTQGREHDLCPSAFATASA